MKLHAASARQRNPPKTPPKQLEDPTEATSSVPSPATRSSPAASLPSIPSAATPAAPLRFIPLQQPHTSSNSVKVFPQQARLVDAHAARPLLPSKPARLQAPQPPPIRTRAAKQPNHRSCFFVAHSSEISCLRPISSKPTWICSSAHKKSAQRPLLIPLFGPAAGPLEVHVNCSPAPCSILTQFQPSEFLLGSKLGRNSAQQFYSFGPSKARFSSSLEARQFQIQQAQAREAKSRNFCGLARFLGPARVSIVATEKLEFGRRRVAIAVFRSSLCQVPRCSKLGF